MVEGRYSRNEMLFGKKGQDRLRSTNVAIVGLGGLGSHVAQQLAHLGVESFGLIDDDIVTESSLNRLVGANDGDVLNETKKTDIARRTIAGINQNALVTVFDGRVSHSEAEPILETADVIFGCVDRDVHRLDLLDASARHQKVIVDLATDVGDEADWYGGRMVFCAGSGCLLCLDVLDQESITLDRMSPQEREADRQIYGVDRQILHRSGPSVVSINGVVASLAVTEFMAYVTGLRDPVRQLTYRGHLGTVTQSLDEGKPDCFYCASIRGS